MGAKIVDNAGIRTMDLPLPNKKHCPLGYQSLLVAMLQSFLFQQQALLLSENKKDHSKMKNESVKKTNTFTIIATNFESNQKV